MNIDNINFFKNQQVNIENLDEILKITSLQKKSTPGIYTFLEGKCGEVYLISIILKKKHLTKN
jgi:hypothetical protein